MGNYRRVPPKVSCRVKIAVLDTGVDLEHRKLKKYKDQAQISQERCRDFVSGDKVIRDGTGHGTHCAHTILKLCSTARLYVARVFESDEADAGTVQKIIEVVPSPEQTLDHADCKQAIKWAVECKVDIISMSFSFTNRHESLRKTISSASGQHDILFFAAATNGGYYIEDPVGFPATMAQVIRVNSCQFNREQSKFSPDSDRNNANALSTLGEEIEAAFPTALNNGAPLKCLTGTSMATAIMAGVAGLLIEFSKLRVGYAIVEKLSESTPQDMEAQLHTAEGMRAVMYHCMAGINPPLAPKYSCIRPWLLFDVRKTSDRIVGDIERALKKGI